MESCPHCGAYLETRSNPQNALLHAMLSDIAKHKEWMGKKLQIETWKRLLVAAYCRAVNLPGDALPALDGRGFDIVYRRTSQFSKREMMDLNEYIQAWCAEEGVELKQ